MTTKNILLTATLSLFAILSVSTIPNFDASAEEERTGYKMVEDVKSVMTFTFRDGVETHEFPVYTMTTDFVSNVGTTFNVQGVVGDAPHFHKALDDSYKYRMLTLVGGSNADYNYRFFDVEVDFFRGEINFNSLGYTECEIIGYKINTEDSNDYESYASSKSGFAITDDVEFGCTGLSSDNPADISMYENTDTDYAVVPLDYEFAEGVRTIGTFDFGTGSERIEFHGFDLDSGYAKGANAGPSFTVERTLDYFPLLQREIDRTRDLSGLHTSYNSDFDVNVDFVNSEKILRNLSFTDCRVSSSLILTESDKEEGFTGKSGFVLLQKTGFSCAGLTSDNSGYDELRGDAHTWSTAMVYNTQPEHSYNVGLGPSVLATFTYADGVEMIHFPMFDQSNVLTKSNPTFTLEGIVGDYPMLYHKADENLSIQSVTGTRSVELFDVDIDLMYGGSNVRGHNYSNCRVLNYDVGSDMDKEESYVKGKFALENTFTFECQGYTPDNPMYDAMFETPVYADTPSTNDLRVTDSWSPGFKLK